MFEEAIHRTAWNLSLAGLLPFLWSSAEVLVGTELLGIQPVHVFLTYGAVILSFLGGMYWMRALMLQGNSRLSQSLLMMSVIPALMGWAAVLIEGIAGLWLLLAGLLGLLGAEKQFMREALLPAWFWHLRLRVSAVVILLNLLLALNT